MTPIAAGRLYRGWADAVDAGQKPSVAVFYFSPFSRSMRLVISVIRMPYFSLRTTTSAAMRTSLARMSTGSPSSRTSLTAIPVGASAARASASWCAPVQR